MNADLVDFLQCPQDGSSVRVLSSGSNRHVVEGSLECTRCGLQYPITSGIPSFLGGLEKTVHGQEAEIESRNKSFERVRYVPAHRKIVIDAFRAAMPKITGFSLLDCGCGNGQLAETWSGARRVVGLDFSPAGLTRFILPTNPPPFDLVHGDATRLPFQSCTFDISLASVLVHHLRTEELRETCIRELHRTVKPGGEVILSVYNWNDDLQRQGEPQEGFFDQAVFYHRYTSLELAAVLGKYFEVERIMGAQVTLAGAYRALKLSGMHITWDRLWRRTSIGRRHSHLLVAVCRRRA
jgi:SAM-dependent methyltransferase